MDERKLPYYPGVNRTYVFWFGEKGQAQVILPNSLSRQDVESMAKRLAQYAFEFPEEDIGGMEKR